jgi:hypothetical protein
MPLCNTLRAMVSINYQSLFVFADIKTGYEGYEDNAKYLDVFGLTGGVVNRKIMDLVFFGLRPYVLRMGVSQIDPIPAGG